MNVYKIRLIGTDLFYQPVKGRWSGKQSNLSVNGKLYHKKPSIKEFGGYIKISNAVINKHNIPYTIDTTYNENQLCIKYPEWEIVVYNLIEDHTYEI